jgi:hypothetical protein
MFKNFFQKIFAPKNRITLEDIDTTNYVLHVCDGEKWVPFAPREKGQWIQNLDTKRYECSYCWKEAPYTVDEEGTVRVYLSEFCPHCGSLTKKSD